MTHIAALTVTANGAGAAPLKTFISRYAIASTTSLSDPEFTLLLTIATVHLPISRQKLFKELLTEQLDWDYLLEMAALHGLEPLLFHHLCTAAPEAAPFRAMSTLRTHCKTIALRNLLLSAKLREVSAHLTSLQIQHIAYKGPLLAELYGNHGALRTYRDLDLLVLQEELPAVRDALHQIGFVDRYGLTEVRQAASFRLGFEHPFSSKAGIDLDVHWRIVQDFKSRAFDIDGLWARKTVVPLLGQDIPALSPEDLMVTLCLHAGHHGWMKLSYMCDLAQLFYVHKVLDWGTVRAHLGDSNTRRIVCLSLYLLQQHWHVDLPESIAALISNDPHIERLAHRIETEIWPNDRPALTTASLWWLLDRTAGENWPDRMRVITGSIFVPSIEDFALCPFSPCLPYLYTGLRIFRLALKYVSSPWPRWWKRKEAEHTPLVNCLHGN
jgi:hypothetical protein